MGLLVQGKWQDKDIPRSNADGSFARPDSSFRNWIGAPDGRYPALPGRYHLFVNSGCPWAYRAILYRSIKHLDPIISLSNTAAAAGPQGWWFEPSPEPVLGKTHLHEVYTQADSTFTGRVTVPVLWDMQSSTIVNNESADIIRMMNSAFDGQAGVSQHNYYPEQLQNEIEVLNQSIYDNVNNGVYRCGFAQSQAAYEAAYDNLFTTLDQLDKRLSQQRYLLGDQLTECDWRLFSTLIRFDLAYYSRFNCNRNRLVEFENLWPYTLDLYQTPDVARTVDIAAIKGIYFGSSAHGILPKGPAIDFTQAHGRAQLSA